MAKAYIEKHGSCYDHITVQYNSRKPCFEGTKIQDNIRYIRCDLSSEEETVQCLSEMQPLIEEIDSILFCAAPRYSLKSFSKSSWLNDFEPQINVQVRSSVIFLRELMPVLVKKKYGRVVFLLSSVVSNVPKGTSGYAIAKHALLGLVKALSIEYAQHNICINSVSPSMTDTAFIEDIPVFVRDSVAGQNPLKRLATANDVIPSIHFLMSKESGFISGQNILVTGGAAG